MTSEDNISVPEPTPCALIPEHIAKNLLEYLRRAQSTGMEAVAWVEAYQFVSQQLPAQPGVPFTGTTPK